MFGLLLILIAAAIAIFLLYHGKPEEIKTSLGEPVTSETPGDVEEDYSPAEPEPGYQEEALQEETSSYILPPEEEYQGSPYIEINGNVPLFKEEDLIRGKECFLELSDLDLFGRCGPAFASADVSMFPEEERESIGMVRPSGWHTERYDDLIEDKYLYNRCHLIAFAICGLNAEERNLITGTRYLNVEGMLPFELKVIHYAEETGNHVLYRVTPIFNGPELVCRGVEMEAMSVEDRGEGLSFNVYIYNVQPGITIDYMTGESWRS